MQLVVLLDSSGSMAAHYQEACAAMLDLVVEQLVPSGGSWVCTPHTPVGGGGWAGARHTHQCSMKCLIQVEAFGRVMLWVGHCD